MIIDQIESEFENARFVTISTDAFNHRELKIFPIILRCFLPTEGVKTRLIELKKLPGKTGEQIFKMLEAILSKWNIQSKMIAYSADQCTGQFWKCRKNWRKNVFVRMQDKFNNNLIGMGCIAHILHNTPHDACLANIPCTILIKF